MADKKNISSKKPSTEKDNLKDYLKDNLSQSFSTDDLQNDEFLQDAVDGLKEFSSTEKIHKSVSQLNHSLHQFTQSKRKTKPIHHSQLMWYVIAVVLIILLVAVAFAVIKMHD